MSVPVPVTTRHTDWCENPQDQTPHTCTSPNIGDGADAMWLNRTSNGTFLIDGLGGARTIENAEAEANALLALVALARRS